jgi:hypothetical protein
VKLPELVTRVDTARKALPAKTQAAKRALAVEARLKNNARKGVVVNGRADGRLTGKVPKVRLRG